MKLLEFYKYIYVFSYLDKAAETGELQVAPSWAPEFKIGLFASRSPDRPNPIGLSIVEIKEISGNEIVISGIDVFNGTPLLDIKPYVKLLDCKEDANDGWYDQLKNKEHSIAHMLGLSHEHAEGEEHTGHGHPQGHGHGHGLDHTHIHTHHELENTPSKHSHIHDHENHELNRHRLKHRNLKLKPFQND